MEDFPHFFSIIEENFEEFGNVIGKKSKFYEILCQEPIFYAILCFFIIFQNIYDFIPSGTPASVQLCFSISEYTRFSQKLIMCAFTDSRREIVLKEN